MASRWVSAQPGGSGRRAPRALLALALLAGLLGVFPLATPRAYADITTNAHDNLRTGWDPSAPNLGPAAVTSSTFGQLFATQLDGQIYAQPLVVGDTVVVGTENNKIYGLNTATGAIKWTRDAGPPWPASATGCADLTPNLGNTSTGVYDASTNTYYLTTKVNDGPDVLHPNWYLHALDVATGAERAGWPILIAGTPSNDPTRPFRGADVNQRPGLLLMDGSVYLAFGAQCDYGLYVGWVVGVNTTSRAIHIWSDQAGPSGEGAGIWQAGGGIMSDGSGRMFVITGNGVVAADGVGTNPPATLGHAVVRLGVGGDGTISTRDFFSPSNAASLNTNDQDLGSGAPVALPSQYFGTSATRNLMVAIGKDGRLFLLNRDHLGGKAQGSGGTDDVVQTLGPYHGVWGRPGVYGGQGGYVYVVQNSAPMLAFKYGTDGQGRPALSLAGNTGEIFGYTSGSPIVTSNGTTPGSAVVWVVSVSGPNGSNGQLCAYDAIPANNQLNRLRCFPIGTGAKFTSPASSNDRVYVGTRDGYLYGFGQPTGAPLTASQTSFGNVAVGTTADATVTATATRTIRVDSVTTNAPFSATPMAQPVTLNAGQTLSVPVSFSPTFPGSVTAPLNFSVTDAGVAQTFGVTLDGVGTKPGLTPSPGTLDFGQIAVGGNKSLTASFTNTGTSNVTVSAVSGPAAPFTVSGLPAPGLVVAPNQSVAVSVNFRPTSATASSSSIAITSAEGTATLAIKGTGVTGVAELSISPAALNFGTVPVGSSATRTLTVTNTGNLNVTVTKAAPPAAPFDVQTPLPEGQVLSPEESLHVAVTFAPGAAGSFNNLYVISADDGRGARNIPVTGTGVNPREGAPLPSVVAGDWAFNGAATMNGSELVLTPATGEQRGSAFFPMPLPSNGLDVSFSATIGGGNGADGMTFAMLDAATSTPQSIGQGGGGLGFGGLTGIAVTLDTYQGPGEPSSNFIGLSTGGNAGGGLTYVATATNIPNLRSGAHSVRVTASNGNVTVSVDGVQALSAPATLPANVLTGFTAATGGWTDRHAVSNVSIASGTTIVPRPGTGWRFNGSATTSGSNVVLTPAQRDQTGSVFYSDPAQTNGLTANFTLTMNGGGATGADGATFALLDPAKGDARRVGAGGSGLGAAGLGGVVVAFVTYPQSAVNSYNWVGVATSAPGGGLTFLSSTTNVPDLRSANRNVAIRVMGNRIVVSVDGAQVLSTPVPSLTSTALVGFTGATGGLMDVHSVANVRIRAGASTVPAPPDTGWTKNGSATGSGGRLQLTPAVSDQAGTAIFSTPVPTGNLQANFTVEIGGGTGADGLTFMLLDATKNTPASLGAVGGGLGFAGLPGVAVTFVTYAQYGDPSNNFIGISTGGSAGALSYAATATTIPNLRNGTHAVDVWVGSTGHMIVKMDGTQVLDAAVPVPANALIGFSGGTGWVNDVHAVNALDITY